MKLNITATVAIVLSLAQFRVIANAINKDDFPDDHPFNQDFRRVKMEYSFIGEKVESRRNIFGERLISVQQIPAVFLGDFKIPLAPAYSKVIDGVHIDAMKGEHRFKKLSLFESIRFRNGPTGYDIYECAYRLKTYLDDPEDDKFFDHYEPFDEETYMVAEYKELIPDLEAYGVECGAYWSNL